MSARSFCKIEKWDGEAAAEKVNNKGIKGIFALYMAYPRERSDFSFYNKFYTLKLATASTRIYTLFAICQFFSLYLK